MHRLFLGKTIIAVTLLLPSTGKAAEKICIETAERTLDKKEDSSPTAGYENELKKLGTLLNGATATSGGWDKKKSARAYFKISTVNRALLSRKHGSGGTQAITIENIFEEFGFVARESNAEHIVPWENPGGRIRSVISPEELSVLVREGYFGTEVTKGRDLDELFNWVEEAEKARLAQLAGKQGQTAPSGTETAGERVELTDEGSRFFDTLGSPRRPKR